MEKSELKLRKALGPSEGGTATFPEELEVIAGCIDRTDAGSGLVVGDTKAEALALWNHRV